MLELDLRLGIAFDEVFNLVCQPSEDGDDAWGGPLCCRLGVLEDDPSPGGDGQADGQYSVVVLAIINCFRLICKGLNLLGQSHLRNGNSHVSRLERSLDVEVVGNAMYFVEGKVP